jgi:methionine transaminase
MITLQSKLPNVGTTIFTTMSQLAQQHNAINLGQGFPDYSMNTELQQLVTTAMANNNNQYAHMNGLPQLRQAIANKINTLYKNTINPETDITVTPGATYALFTIFSAIIHPGDEVIIFEPAYDCYIPAIELYGGTPVLIPLQHPTYSINWDFVKTKITTKTKAILINTPHNPTGAVLSHPDMLQLQTIVANTNIVVISDEVYEHLIFEDKIHHSILKYPQLFARAFVTFSFGKVYNCTGWKLGYAVAPANLMAEFRKIHQFNAFTCNTPMQVAIAQFLQNTNEYINLGPQLQQKRNYLRQVMAQTPLKPLLSYGSYFELYDYSAVSNLPEAEFAVHLTKNFGVATIPVSAFYKTAVNNQVVRFCFSKSEQTLEQAAQRLKNL